MDREEPRESADEIREREDERVSTFVRDDHGHLDQRKHVSGRPLFRRSNGHQDALR